MKKLILSILLAVLATGLSAQTVYITSTGSKYHRSSCHYIKKSGRSISLQDAISTNYTACSVCKPGGTPAATKQYKTNSNTNSKKPSSSNAQQCTGTTQAGNRCKRTTTNSSGRCYQH